VGATGNVIPRGELGAHIHFMVIQDKNNDGSFDDNIPDGVTDPFGWQSQNPDPWPNFNFFYNGQNRSGNSSSYLWINKLANLSTQLTSNGGNFQIGGYNFNFPQDTTNQNLNIQIESAPTVEISETVQSIGTTINITAKDSLGNIVSLLNNFYTLTIDFSSFDLTAFDTNSMAIYSSEDGINWTQEVTTVDINNRIASTQLNHFSYFALMAEKIDTTPPTTTPILSGLQGQLNWFRSDVEVTLSAQDNENGLGIDYTLYKINDGDWQQYSTPLTFSTEGHYKVEFYSVDKGDNIEEVKSIEFNIDKTAPFAAISANPNILWPPNKKMVDVTISGSASDNNQFSTQFQVNDEYHQAEPAITNFNSAIKLQSWREGQDLDGRKYVIKVIITDIAGNMTEVSTEVLVPHDSGAG
jgi:hypothetical protein